jgi:hypothetical protein
LSDSVSEVVEAVLLSSSSLLRSISNSLSRSDIWPLVIETVFESKIKDLFGDSESKIKDLFGDSESKIKDLFGDSESKIKDLCGDSGCTCLVVVYV